jgi:hypothetical protein
MYTYTRRCPVELCFNYTTLSVRHYASCHPHKIFLFFWIFLFQQKKIGKKLLEACKDVFVTVWSHIILICKWLVAEKLLEYSEEKPNCQGTCPWIHVCGIQRTLYCWRTTGICCMLPSVLSDFKRTCARLMAYRNTECICIWVHVKQVLFIPWKHIRRINSVRCNIKYNHEIYSDEEVLWSCSFVV